MNILNYIKQKFFAPSKEANPVAADTNDDGVSRPHVIDDIELCELLNYAIIYEGRVKDVEKVLVDNNIQNLRFSSDTIDLFNDWNGLEHPLNKAIESKKLGIAEFLLKKGMDPNVFPCPCNPFTNALLGSPEFVMTLLGYSARPVVGWKSKEDGCMEFIQGVFYHQNVIEQDGADIFKIIDDVIAYGYDVNNIDLQEIFDKKYAQDCIKLIRVLQRNGYDFKNSFNQNIVKDMIERLIHDGGALEILCALDENNVEISDTMLLDLVKDNHWGVDSQVVLDWVNQKRVAENIINAVEGRLNEIGNETKPRKM